MLPGLPIEFTEPPRRCPTCGGTRWMDRPCGWQFGSDGERVVWTLGDQVCTACWRQEHPVRKTMGTERDRDPDAGGHWP